MSAFWKRDKRKPHKKNELVPVQKKVKKHRKKRVSLGEKLKSVGWISAIYDRLPARVRRFLGNKYAIGSVIILISIIVLVVIALIPPVTEEKKETADSDQGTDVIYIIDEHGNKIATTAVEDDSIVMQNQKEPDDPVLLSYNADTRSGYMNNCIFLGDSRTVAMVSYGFISDANALAKVGISHWQVLSTTFEQNSGAKFTLSDYLHTRNEPVIYVCYGVNGMNGLDEEKYKATYTELVDKIISLAGDRHVVLMSIWPVDDNGRYRNSAKNEWVYKYNEFLYNLAAEKGLNYLDVASILKDDNGNMKREYDSGDGLHYRASAYNDILNYIIHHPVPGVSDEGEFVVHYVKPRGEYKDIMTETPTLPQNIQLEDGTFPFILPTLAPTDAPTTAPTEAPQQEEKKEEEEQKPTEAPTPEPTKEPTQAPQPTEQPKAEEPTPEPTKEPTPEPTPEPTEIPVTTPTPEPTEIPVTPSEPGGDNSGSGGGSNSDGGEQGQ